MKAYEYFGKKVTVGQKNNMERYSHLVGKTVKAIPVEESGEEETFTVVGFVPVPHNMEKINCVLKSRECNFVVEVEVEQIGKKKEEYAFYVPTYILLLEEE